MSIKKWFFMKKTLPIYNWNITKPLIIKLKFSIVSQPWLIPLIKSFKTFKRALLHIFHYQSSLLSVRPWSSTIRILYLPPLADQNSS